jgi:hypothetical protein
MPLGGKSKYAAIPLGQMIDENEPERVEFFEREVYTPIRRKWEATAPAKKAAGVGLPCELALLAYDELMNRRSAPPTFVPEEESK